MFHSVYGQYIQHQEVRVVSRTRQCEIHWPWNKLLKNITTSSTKVRTVTHNLVTLKTTLNHHLMKLQEQKTPCWFSVHGHRWCKNIFIATQEPKLVEKVKKAAHLQYCLRKWLKCTGHYNVSLMCSVLFCVMIAQRRRLPDMLFSVGKEVAWVCRETGNEYVCW